MANPRNNDLQNIVALHNIQERLGECIDLQNSTSKPEIEEKLKVFIRQIHKVLTGETQLPGIFSYNTLGPNPVLIHRRIENVTALNSVVEKYIKNFKEYYKNDIYNDALSDSENDTPNEPPRNYTIYKLS